MCPTLTVKAHLPAPKEAAVSSLFFVIAIIVDCHRNCSREVIIVVKLIVGLLPSKAQVLTRISPIMFRSIILVKTTTLLTLRLTKDMVIIN
jgi:hypothetical protein